jgi:hypothetical protein
MASPAALLFLTLVVFLLLATLTGAVVERWKE